MHIYDVHIKNGEVIDGTGAPKFKSDIVIDNGKIIITSNGFSLREGSYDMFVFDNSKKGGNNYFKAIFTEGNFEGLMHTVTIKVWENNMPVYLFLSDQPRKVLKGNCE